jgi:predicted negative regulator of RcsB-dependent stress response
MNEYETEEQQVAALKKWWKENGTSLLVGLLIGVSALFGWRYYGEQSNAQAVQASDIYLQVLQSVVTSSKLGKPVDEKAIDLSNQLINNYVSTPYPALAALALAKAEYENGNVDVATTQFQLAVKHANDDVVKQVASLRLSRLYIDQKKYDDAAAILNKSHDAALDAQYEELKGDLYVAKGDNAQARMAYDKALELQGDNPSELLKLKRQNLGARNFGARNPAASLGADLNAGLSSRIHLSTMTLSTKAISTKRATNKPYHFVNL